MLETTSLTKIEYAESDGKPIAETDTHRIQMTDVLIHPLRERYRHQTDVYVSGNLFLYAEREARLAAEAEITRLRTLLNQQK